MKITHPLLNPQHAPVARERSVVSTVDAAGPAGDAKDPRRSPSTAVLRLNDEQRAELDRRADAHAALYAAPSRASRALAAYATVADDNDRDELRHMLGFDSYA